MNAHKVIESIYFDSDLNKDEFNYLFENLMASVKFEIDLDITPEFSDDEMTAQMQILKMPFPICYFEIPNYGALLTFHYEDEPNFVFLNFFYKIGKSWNVLNPKLAVYLNLKNRQVTTFNKELELINKYNEFMKENGNKLVSMPNAVISALSLIQCSNVFTVDNFPDVALNKKRIKNGKQPLFVYKTLHVKTPNTSKIKNKLGGTHASPRLHVRRGHIRHYSNHSVWIENCIVGSSKKGIVLKDYKVT